MTLAESRERSLEEVTRELISLQKISSAMISTSYLDDVLQIIVEGLEKALQYDAGILFIADQTTNCFYPHITHRNAFIQTLESRLKINLGSLSISGVEKNNLLVQSVLQRKILFSELLNEVLVGASANIPPDLSEAISQATGVRRFAAVPMIIRNDVAGVILCATRRPAITNPEIESLRNFANQAGLALDNAQIMNSLKSTRSQLSQQNEKLNDALGHLKALEEMKNGLTGMVVHDMKNPLTSIRGYLELIIETTSSAAENQALLGYIRKAYESSEDLLKMIHNLLDISRMEEGKFALSRTECRISDVLTAVCEQLDIVAKSNQRDLRLKVADDVPLISIDADIIHRVVANLVSNAIKHTRKGGHIELSTQVHGNDVRVCVQDDGEGIPKEYLESIFEKFSQVKGQGYRNTHNVGLGLTFCKMAVETHGGKIWVESEPDQGSRFYFTLPRQAN